MAVSVLLFNSSAAGASFGAKVCERHMSAAAKRHDVPLAILYAVGLTETGRGDGLRPYALNIDGRSIYDLSKSDALKHFHEARAKGVKLIDVGCMQINHYWHKDHFASVDDMLEPARNVDYAALFLKRLKEREGTWTRAVARYHAGAKNKPAQKRYICSLIRHLVRERLGNWTSQAKTFCNVKELSKLSLSNGANDRPKGAGKPSRAVTVPSAHSRLQSSSKTAWSAAVSRR